MTNMMPNDPVARVARRVAACAAILLLVASVALPGTGPWASASSGDERHPKAGWGEDGGHSWKGICPSQKFLSGPDARGEKKILDVSWTAKNDEDSGLDGYWALDHFRENLKVWSLPNGTLYAEKTYEGLFVAPQGGSSPGSSSDPPTGLVQGETVYGTIEGGYVATFSGTFAPGGNPVYGPIGTFDYGGTMSDVLLQSYDKGQAGDAHPYDWEGAYFTGVSGFSQPHWGWSYKLDPVFHAAGGSDQWCNYSPADGGNSGDIYSP